VAALYLVNYHHEHGIPFADLTIPFAVDTIMIKKELHLQQVEEILDIDLEELKLLNPQYKRLVIPAYNEPYPLRLKHADILRFIELEDTIYQHKYLEFFTPVKVYEASFTGVSTSSSDYKKVYHTVKQGETLAAIANKYGLSVYEIRNMNNLSGNSVKSKQKLLVGYEYIKEGGRSSVQQAQVIDNKAKQPPVTHTPAPQNQAKHSADIYTVKQGDTLSSIAAKYGTTAKKIAEYNNMKNMHSLNIGQKLKIPPR
jgi:membrane-bound lytic murein transglycosylase D